jgi:hypothetical protein
MSTVRWARTALTAASRATVSTSACFGIWATRVQGRRGAIWARSVKTASRTVALGHISTRRPRPPNALGRHGSACVHHTRLMETRSARARAGKLVGAVSQSRPARRVLGA